MVARRDAALRALAEPGAARSHAARIAEIAAARRERLLELEILLDLDTPPELQADKRALQVKQLRERFSSAASPNNASAAQRLVTWCAEPGITEGPDRQRAERLFAKIALTR